MTKEELKEKYLKVCKEMDEILEELQQLNAKNDGCGWSDIDLCLEEILKNTTKQHQLSNVGLIAIKLNNEYYQLFGLRNMLLHMAYEMGMQ